MVKVALISVAMVGVAVLLLGVRVFFCRNGRFPSAHIHSNEALREKGISCHRDPR